MLLIVFLCGLLPIIGVHLISSLQFNRISRQIDNLKMQEAMPIQDSTGATRHELFFTLLASADTGTCFTTISNENKIVQIAGQAASLFAFSNFMQRFSDKTQLPDVVIKKLQQKQDGFEFLIQATENQTHAL